MSYFAHDRHGAMFLEPTGEELVALLESLRIVDNEHPDVSLTHESGWCLSAFGSGLVHLENVETGDGPWHMWGQSNDAVLGLWNQLVAGHIENLRSAAWLPGYGGQ